jgi:hypothetical protein
MASCDVAALNAREARAALVEPPASGIDLADMRRPSIQAWPTRRRGVLAMRIDLPFWLSYLILCVEFWFLVAPAAILLLLAGWHVRDREPGLSWLAFGAAALLAIPLAGMEAFLVFDDWRSAEARAAFERILDHEETIANLPLPAGSKVIFKDPARHGVNSIELPRASTIRGVFLFGALVWNAPAQTWSGQLAVDQQLGGWPCRSGPVELDGDGAIESCELGATHTLLGYALPVGTHVRRGHAGKPWTFSLPAHAGLVLPALATTAPGGVALSVGSDGRLEGITSGYGQTLVVRGVPLSSMNVFVRGDCVVAALAKSFVVAGEMRPAETPVQVDFKTGDISLAKKDFWTSE